MPYPLTKFHFSVDWGGTNISFQEVSGLDMEHDVVEYRAGTDTSFTKLNMPGLKKMSDVNLKRGMFASDNDFFQWMNETQMTNPVRRNITISLLNEEHSPVVVWNLKDAWPFKIQCTDLKAEASEVALETLVLKHAGLTVEYL